MTDYSTALDRMPHKGAMQLIASVEALDETTIYCRAKSHKGRDYPLRTDGRLMTAALVEIGAQAAAAHASIHGQDGSHIGMLLSLQKVEILQLRAEDAPAPLVARASLLHGAASGGALPL